MAASRLSRPKSCLSGLSHFLVLNQREPMSAFPNIAGDRAGQGLTTKRTPAFMRGDALEIDRPSRTVMVM